MMMDKDKMLRLNLLALLGGGNAHMSFDDAVKDFPVSKINTRFPNGTYTFWHLIEHLRIAQWDILDFIRNPDYREMEWPKDYWPPRSRKATGREWKATIAMFKRDSRELQRIVSGNKPDLYSRIPHGTGQTVLREILTVSDHNAYHIGELAIMRQVADAWGKNHKSD